MTLPIIETYYFNKYYKSVLRVLSEFTFFFLIYFRMVILFIWNKCKHFEQSCHSYKKNTLPPQKWQTNQALVWNSSRTTLASHLGYPLGCHLFWSVNFTPAVLLLFYWNKYFIDFSLDIFVIIMKYWES